jgi:integrase
MTEPLTVVTTSSGTPLHHLVDDYLISCRARGLAPGTISTSYGYPLRCVFLPWCDEHGIDGPEGLTHRTIDAFSVDLLDRPGRRGRKISKFTVHSYVRAIRSFLTWCAKEGEKVEARPSLPRLPRRVIDVLSREEITKMEEVVPAERDKIIIRILADCGIRASELCQLKTDDVVRHDRQAFLRVFGKGERWRLVPVQPALLRRIERYIRSGRPADSPYAELFLGLRKGRSGDYEPLTRSGLFQIVEHAAVRAGLEARNVHPHLFRHSFITNALRAGVSPLILSQVAGHSSMRMIEQVYSHLNAGDSYDALLRAITT